MQIYDFINNIYRNRVYFLMSINIYPWFRKLIKHQLHYIYKAIKKGKMKKLILIILTIGTLAATSCIEKSACRKNYKGNKRKGMDLAPGFK